MRVDLGCPKALVPQEVLDNPEVRTPLQEMRGEAMPEGMGRDALLDTGGSSSVLDDPLYRPSREVPVPTAAGKQPFPCGICVPIDTDGFNGPLSQERVTVLPTFPPSDAEEAPIHLEVLGPESYDLPHSEPGGIEEQ
jgi:hypothetical protein